MRERDEAEHGRADRDQHRAQAEQPGVEQRLAQRLAALVPLLDEVEQHDDVADDHADQADDPRNAMNPNGAPMMTSETSAADRAVTASRRTR